MFDGAPKECGGFSLAELIVVLAILAVIMAAVVPVFDGSFAGVRSDAAVRDLVAFLKYAQERAITDTVAYRFCMRPDTGEYWIEAQTQDTGTPVFRETNEHQTERRRLPEGVTMDKPKARKSEEGGEYYLEFSPSGWCDAGEIKLSKDGESLTHIRTTGASGRVTVTKR